jgi:hypothetical protein
MIRSVPIVVLAASAWVLAMGVARANDALPGSEESQFSFHSVDEGFLRLDGRTGHVSQCLRRPAGWLCRLLPDERMVLETEIARLQADNSAMKKEFLARSIPLPGVLKQDPPSKAVEDPRTSLPSEAELDRMMAFIEKVWRRLVEMVVTTQRDITKKP